jgi:hypothetical protein
MQRLSLNEEVLICYQEQWNHLEIQLSRSNIDVRIKEVALFKFREIRSHVTIEATLYSSFRYENYLRILIKGTELLIDTYIRAIVDNILISDIFNRREHYESKEAEGSERK